MVHLSTRGDIERVLGRGGAEDDVKGETTYPHDLGSDEEGEEAKA